MTDYEQVIVDIDAREHDAAALAERARRFLIERGVILPEPVDADLSDDAETMYPPGPAASTVINNADAPVSADPDTGVLFLVGRCMTPVIESKTVLTCTSCGALLDVTEEDAWYEASDAWDEGDDGAAFVCLKCGVRRGVAEWDGPSAWGFGWLGICFRDWPELSPAFVEELSGALGSGTGAGTRRRLRHIHVHF